MQPGREISGAIRENRIVGEVFVEPAYDLAHVERARDRSRLPPLCVLRVRLFGSTSPCDCVDRRRPVHCSEKRSRCRRDCNRGLIDTTELLASRMYVNQPLPRLGDFQQCVARGRDLAKPFADHEQYIGIADSSRELRIDPDPDVAGIVRMAVVEEVLAAKCAGHREGVRFGDCAQCGMGLRVPPCAAHKHERPLRTGKKRARCRRQRRIGRRGEWIDARAVRTFGSRAQHVFGKGEHDRPGSARHRRAVGMGNVLGDALGAVDLCRPLRDAPVHPPIVDFLEGLAIRVVAAHLTDEDDHRARILRRRVDADGRIRSTWTAGDEYNPRPAC